MEHIALKTVSGFGFSFLLFMSFFSSLFLFHVKNSLQILHASQWAEHTIGCYVHPVEFTTFTTLQLHLFYVSLFHIFVQIVLYLLNMNVLCMC